MKNNLLIFSFILVSFVMTAQTLILCEQSAGATYLSQDEWDGYYDRVNALEIAIQLKNDSLDLNDRKPAIEKYKASYHESEVLSVNDEEADKLRSLFTKLFNNINNLNKELLPDTIRMIIVKGRHYGESTFFTRGNAIITSRASLANMAPEDFEHIMFHELSHIISRYHPTLKDELYGHFGFQKIDEPILILSDFYNRLLYNPDGVLMDYAISLMMPDSQAQLFVPVIYTKANHFDPKAFAFFGYLSFQLMPLDKVGDVYFMRDVNALGDLDIGYVMKKYFERITLNTQYIIHPDEILADNFMYLFRNPEANATLDGQLLGRIQKSFSSFKTNK